MKYVENYNENKLQTSESKPLTPMRGDINELR